jgi:uncharacterized protein
MTRGRETLSAAQARRLAIAAQGLHKPRPAVVKRADIHRTIARLGLLQIDSVNVLVRAHYMPLFSRLGAYDRQLLEADCGHEMQGAPAQRRLFEYWAHEASLVPLELYPLMRWRMEAAARGEDLYSHLANFGRERRPFIHEVLQRITDRGGLSASALDHGAAGAGGWWGWSEAKIALEWLFWTGGVTTARRETAGFTRIYDLPERVFPAAVLNAPYPERAEAQRQLLAHAIAALGVATEADLRDYFRLPVADTRARLAELVEAGALLPVIVEGWNKPAYLDPAAKIPRQITTASLHSPFDPLVWFRARTERLFNFHYRIEIYTPAHKRQYGYYCLPFRIGDRIVARVDLKADRAAGVLRVLSTHLEAGVDAGTTYDQLNQELVLMTHWLGLRHLEASS